MPSRITPGLDQNTLASIRRDLADLDQGGINATQVLEEIAETMLHWTISHLSRLRDLVPAPDAKEVAIPEEAQALLARARNVIANIHPSVATLTLHELARVLDRAEHHNDLVTEAEATKPRQPPTR
jgi:hypothetical protein